MIHYEPYEHKLANEIAETLKDRDSLDLFLSMTKKYNEQFLKKMLAKVMSIDEGKIRRTRGALFTYLVNQHGSRNGSRS